MEEMRHILSEEILDLCQVMSTGFPTLMKMDLLSAFAMLRTVSCMTQSKMTEAASTVLMLKDLILMMVLVHVLLVDSLSIVMKVLGFAMLVMTMTLW